MKHFSLSLFLLLALAGNVFAQNVPSYIPSNGLVGWWPFNGNANDESGHGYNLTVSGNASLTSNRNNQSNSAYYLDGTGDYLSTNGNIYAVAGDKTLSMFFKLDDSTRITNTLYNTYPHRYESMSYNTYFLSQPYGFSYCLGDGTNSSWTTCGASSSFFPTFSKSQWNQITFVKSGTVWSFYLNGNLVYTYTDIRSNLSGMVQLYFGAISISSGLNPPNEEFKGKIDDIGLWNRALSSTEVSQLYTAQSVNPTNSDTVFNNFPSGISYQAVARDSTGQPLANSTMIVRFTLRDSSISGTAVYTETHRATTNFLGLFNVVIGSGTTTTSTYSSINWMGPQKFLSVEINSGSGFQLIGNQQLLSVPYANAAKSATQLINPNLPVYNDNVSAIAGGLQPGQLYRTSAGVVMVAF